MTERDDAQNPMLDLLDQYLADAVFDEPDEELVIEDPSVATGLLRRLRRIARQEDQIRRAATHEQLRIQHWEAEQLGPLARTRAWIERALEGWARSTIDPKAKVRSVSLPTGRVGLRQASVKVEIVDEDEARRWVREAAFDELLLRPAKPRELDRTQVHKMLHRGAQVSVSDDGTEARYSVVTADGDVVPGLLFVSHPSGDVVTIQPRADEEVPA